MDWISKDAAFPPLMLYRRYLKLAWQWLTETGRVDDKWEGSNPDDSPFNFEYMCTKFPSPDVLCLVPAAEESEHC